MTQSNTTVCEHGSLRRSCSICEAKQIIYDLIIAVQEFRDHTFKRIYGPGVTMQDRRTPGYKKVDDFLDLNIKAAQNFNGSFDPVKDGRVF